MLGASPNSKKIGALELQKCFSASPESQLRTVIPGIALNQVHPEADNDLVCDTNSLYIESNKNNEPESHLRVKKAWEGSFNENSNDESTTENMAMFIIGGKECNDYTIFKRPISMWKLEVSFE